MAILSQFDHAGSVHHTSFVRSIRWPPCRTMRV